MQNAWSCNPPLEDPGCPVPRHASPLTAFCTSTRVVEAGCKVVIGTRLKRAGMHWTVKGANTIIALRCSRLGGRFEDFWERRSDQRKTAA
jgi:hypothetical protein